MNTTDQWLMSYQRNPINCGQERDKASGGIVSNSGGQNIVGNNAVGGLAVVETSQSGAVRDSGRNSSCIC